MKTDIRKWAEKNCPKTLKDIESEKIHQWRIIDRLKYHKEYMLEKHQEDFGRSVIYCIAFIHDKNKAIEFLFEIYMQLVNSEKEVKHENNDTLQRRRKSEKDRLSFNRH